MLPDEWIARSMAWADALGPPSTTQPFAPDFRSSGIRPTGVATTGTPQASDSRQTVGIASLIEGRTVASTAENREFIRSWETMPRKRWATPSKTCRDAASPDFPPASNNVGRVSHSEIALARKPRFFSDSNRPAKSTYGRRLRSQSRLARSGSLGQKTFRSIPTAVSMNLDATAG